MANEAVLLYQLEPPIPFIVADGTGIGKGAILKLSDPFTAATSDGDEDYVAGVAASEKIASDGKTKLGVYLRGVFKMILSGSVTAGQAVAKAANTNIIKVADATCVGAKTLGIALETGAEGESIAVLLSPGVNNTAYS